MQEENIKVCFAKTIRSLIEAANEQGLTKDQIISIIKDDQQWFLIYVK